jgi:hypothetical protein
LVERLAVCVLGDVQPRFCDHVEPVLVRGTLLDNSNVRDDPTPVHALERSVSSLEPGQVDNLRV